MLMKITGEGGERQGDREIEARRKETYSSKFQNIVQ